MNMKERLTLRNVVIWGAALLGVVFFFLTFTIKGYYQFTESGDVTKVVFDNILWDGTASSTYFNGKFDGMAKLAKSGAYPLSIIGAILLLVCSLGMVAISIFVKNDKIRKYVSIGAGVAVIAGGIFIFFVKETIVRSICLNYFGSLDKLDEFKKSLTASYSAGAMAAVVGVVSILVGCAFGVSIFLPEKKLVK